MLQPTCSTKVEIFWLATDSVDNLWTSRLHSTGMYYHTSFAKFGLLRGSNFKNSLGVCLFVCCFQSFYCCLYVIYCLLAEKSCPLSCSEFSEIREAVIKIMIFSCCWQITSRFDSFNNGNQRFLRKHLQNVMSMTMNFCAELLHIIQQKVVNFKMTKI